MPTYEYLCNKCSHRFEVFQGIRDKHLRKCPSCGRLALKRLVGSGGALIFKGSGFYITDYRSPDYKTKQSEDTAKPAVVPKTEKNGKDKPAK
jgi:putative FmdB family regulatory protein